MSSKAKELLGLVEAKESKDQEMDEGKMDVLKKALADFDIAGGALARAGDADSKKLHNEAKAAVKAFMKSVGG